MKKIIFVVFACTTGTLIAGAQTEKGNMFVGAGIGNTSYSSQGDNYSYSDGNSRQTDIKINKIVLNPTMGWFVTNHLIAGANVGLNYTHNKNNTNITEAPASTSNKVTNTFTVDAGPFLRYYFFNGQPSNTLLFVQADGSIGAGSGSSSGSGTTANYTYTSTGKVSNVFTYDGGASVGITHFIQKNVGLDIAAGYLYTHQKSSNTDVNDRTMNAGGKTTINNNYDLASHVSGITLSAGFHWFLQGKNHG